MHHDQTTGQGPLQPCFLASLFLHAPIGIQYLRALREEAPIDHADCAFAGRGVERGNACCRDAACFGRLHDGDCQWMFARAFDARRKS